jgi:hypothetical protein
MAFPPDHFDRGKPFYPLVVVYTAAISGLMGMMHRGVLDFAAEASDGPTLDEMLDTITTGVTEIDEACASCALH